MSFAIKALAFPSGGKIPREYSCEGADVSPALRWNDAPARTQAFALILDDPDAPGGTWTHWVMWNIPRKSEGVPEGVAQTAEFRDGTRQGKNDFKRIGYGGPCPPPGKAHRYFFRLYALDTSLKVKAGAERAELERAMRGHVLAEAEWMGRYAR